MLDRRRRGDLPDDRQHETLARLLGLPYFPVTPTFPWLGPLGAVPLPSKWIIEFGEPIATDGYGEGSADDPMLVFNLTDQVRETIQHTLYRLLCSAGPSSSDAVLARRSAAPRPQLSRIREIQQYVLVAATYIILGDRYRGCRAICARLAGWFGEP